MTTTGVSSGGGGGGVGGGCGDAGFDGAGNDAGVSGGSERWLSWLLLRQRSRQTTRAILALINLNITEDRKTIANKSVYDRRILLRRSVLSPKLESESIENFSLPYLVSYHEDIRVFL